MNSALAPHKPGQDKRTRRDAIIHLSYDEWEEHVDQWTATEMALKEMEDEIDEENAAYLRNLVSNNQSETPAPAPAPSPAPAPTDSVPMAEQKEDIPEDGTGEGR